MTTEIVAIEDLVVKARLLIQSVKSSIKDYFELGKITDEAQKAGLGLRDFAVKVGVSPSTLSYAQRFFAKYKTFENVPKRLPSFGKVKKDVRLGGKQSSEPNRLTYLNDRTHTLIECLHYYIRHSETHLAMRVASELSLLGDPSAVGFLWNEILVCSAEETSDPLTLTAVHSLWHQIRSGDGRLGNGEDHSYTKRRFAMIAAYLMAKAPKDRSGDDAHSFRKVVGDALIDARDTVEPLLQSKFEPTPIPSYPMHRDGKAGWEGDFNMAYFGSVCEGKDSRYATFRAEFDRLLKEILGIGSGT